jgi:O-antigen/teichoic acid export membrane protein
MRDILKQSGWLFGAQIFARGIGFFYTIYLARSLGVEGFGLFSAALAYFAIFSTLAEFGFNRFLVREIALDPKNISNLLYNIGFFRIVLTGLFYLIFILPIWFFDADKLRAGLVALSVIAVFPLALAETIDSVFVATRKLQFSSVAMVIVSVITTLTGVFLVSNDFGPWGPVLALILGQTVYLIVLFSILKSQQISILSKIKFGSLKKILLGSLPYGILGILGLLYFRIDTLILSYLKGNYDTGIYTAGFKFLEATNLIPIAVSLGVFPVMARLQNESISKLKKLYLKMSFLMFLVGFLITLIFIFILPFLITLVLPEYVHTIDVLKILSLAIPFMFVHATAAQVVLSSEKYLKPLIVLSVFPLILNIILNFLFVPMYGFMAASWITVFSDIFSTTILLIFLHRYFFKNA